MSISVAAYGGPQNVAESLKFLEYIGREYGFTLQFYTLCCIAFPLFFLVVSTFNIYMGLFIFQFYSEIIDIYFM